MAGSRGLGADAASLVQESAPQLDDLFRRPSKNSGLKQNSSEKISEPPVVPVEPTPPLKRGRGRPPKSANESPLKETKSYFIDSELAEKIRTYSFHNREKNSSVVEAALSLFFALDEANLLNDIDAYSVNAATHLTREEVIKQALTLFFIEHKD